MAVDLEARVREDNSASKPVPFVLPHPTRVAPPVLTTEEDGTAFVLPDPGPVLRRVDQESVQALMDVEEQGEDGVFWLPQPGPVAKVNMMAALAV
jgi:hypothetical protein